jgi:hypothetical protein
LIAKLLADDFLGQSAADEWMDHIISEKEQRGTFAQGIKAKNANPFEELERYFRDPVVPKQLCPEIIPWWGVSIKFPPATL